MLLFSKVQQAAKIIGYQSLPIGRRNLVRTLVYLLGELETILFLIVLTRVSLVRVCRIGFWLWGNNLIHNVDTEPLKKQRGCIGWELDSCTTKQVLISPESGVVVMSIHSKYAIQKGGLDVEVQIL